MKLVVFDMDGTLIDTAGFIVSTMRAAFEQQGLEPVTDDATHNIIGLSLDVALGELSGLEGEPLSQLCETYKSTYRARVNDEKYREPLFEGTIELLHRLKERDDVLLGIATGKGLAGVERILGLHDLGDWFVTKQTPDHNPSKPHPGMLLRAMQETGAEPQHTVMIGDTSYDMGMAKAANTGALGVLWGSHDLETLTETGAHVVIDRHAHMLDAIDDILETRGHLHNA